MAKPSKYRVASKAGQFLTYREVNGAAILVTTSVEAEGYAWSKAVAMRLAETLDGGRIVYAGR